MPARVLHLTDFHVGAHDRGRDEIEAAVRALVAAWAPELVIATGDLTHRNRRAEHARAAAFLRSLGPPVLALPGNHDLPALPPARLLAPFAAFLREWPETEPVFRSDDLVVCGVNSVRPWKYQRGALTGPQLAHVRSMLTDAPRGALRVVALHHHLATPPWRTSKRTVPRRSHVLAALAEAGAELVLGGHTHQGIVLERREFMASAGEPGMVLAGAPGLGRPRPGRHAEAAGVLLVDADEHELRVETRAWLGDRLEPIAERVFPRAPATARPE
jgi:3',5'-cyclic AMP phosphodiesterase CpdA